MIDVRRITLGDVPAVTCFALDALRTAGARDVPLHVCEPRVQSMVQLFACDRSHFNLAAFAGESCVAALAAIVADMPFFERQEAHVVIWFSKEPGMGVRMARRFMRWVASEPRVRRVQWGMNPGRTGERMQALLTRRFGFGVHTNLVFHKG